MQNLSPTLQILLARFDGQILIPFTHASKTAGFAEQTARNLESQKKFPIKTQKRGGRRFIHIEDLATYIESQRVTATPRGRPTKSQQRQKAERGGELR
jgi:hypothetical protein